MAAKDRLLSKKTAGTDTSPSPLLSRKERLASGKALRQQTPCEVQGIWKSPGSPRDVIAILQASNRHRLPELVPIRYGRMLRSPLAFLRGSASLMAHDLATAPRTGVNVQACGDCHLLNFGLFASPERNLVFDLNDFDETLPGPWEWDIKRLATSFAVAARDRGASATHARGVAVDCVRAYRESLRAYSKLTPLEIWYSRLDTQTLLEMSANAKERKQLQQLFDRAHDRGSQGAFPKITEQVAGQLRIIDQPPTIHHVDDADFLGRVHRSLSEYRNSLSDERRVLFDRYQLADAALKVVGIGSVGTRCYIALMLSADNNPLILQFKEAGQSVLEPHVARSQYENHGQRVVMGQRLMQASSDIFLGWMRGPDNRDYYVRQLRDMKLSMPVEDDNMTQLERYAAICGLTLARAHARSGDAATISGYLGKDDDFDQALGKFALLYAEQTREDHAVLVKAVKAGQVEAVIEGT
jgi:uncharacterized protein (DUF2252 family)